MKLKSNFIDFFKNGSPYIRFLRGFRQGTALDKKPIVAQLVKEFPAFYGTQSFVAVFAKACHLIVS
jgi:hypothetical protein